MTQPPIVPGPDPTEPQPAPPPQVVYVQAPPGVTSQQVTSGIIDAGIQWIYVLLAIFVGIPAICCLGWGLIYGLGKIFG